jgi:hypothetical protein
MKKVLFWIAIAFLIFFIGYNPVSAAHVFDSLGDAIGAIFKGIGTFFGNLAK